MWLLIMYTGTAIKTLTAKNIGRNNNSCADPLSDRSRVGPTSVPVVNDSSHGDQLQPLSESGSARPDTA